MKMRRKIRVYLVTSVISALFDERNPERKSLTEAFFAEIDNFETFIPHSRHGTPKQIEGCSIAIFSALFNR
ncbi:MAG: hypothetical protein C4B56_04375 [Candidatus Methanophagaceae archaeon]|nr:MAG: hypothetical protein C4B56_04375 [Methanophagales archaeon]